MYGNEFEDLSYMFEGMDTDALAGIIGGVAIFGLLMGVFGIVLYVLKSLGMYTIAKRRGINNPWLAWLPIGNEWIAGSISDQYRYVAKNQTTNRRVIMLILAIAGIVLGGASTSASLSSFAKMMEAAMAENYDAMMAASSSGATGGLIGLLGSGVSIASIVFWYMSMYDLYSSSCPQNNVLFLVLSIIFGFLEPFFIFCNRNKDEGMPMRTNEFISQPPVEPWENVPQE